MTAARLRSPRSAVVLAAVWPQQLNYVRFVLSGAPAGFLVQWFEVLWELCGPWPGGDEPRGPDTPPRSPTARAVISLRALLLAAALLSLGVIPWSPRVAYVRAIPLAVTWSTRCSSQRRGTASPSSRVCSSSPPARSIGGWSHGAKGGSRTPIAFRLPDPKSGASANSATFAVRT